MNDLAKEKIKNMIAKAIEENNGILRLKPAWVARSYLPPGKRLGLDEKDYNVGGRGWISERWLGSTTKADNAVGPEDEGLSYLEIDKIKDEVSLKKVIDVAGDLIMGKEYFKTHKGLGRLAKIFDYASRIPFHFHQMKEDAVLVGANSKDEAYFYPEGYELGKNPETFFGVHPYINEQKKYDLLLPYLENWNSDLILRHSKAYSNIQGEGFLLQSGILHAPGTALTIELQEDSDVFAILQAKVAGKIISKDLLFKNIRKEDKEKYGEKIILSQIDWVKSGDPYFYENHHLEPIYVNDSRQDGGIEYWIFYGTNKFSGKKLIIKPSANYISSEKGVYNIFIYSGKGKYGGFDIEAGKIGFDELLITHDRAKNPIEIRNEGYEDLKIIKFFGPDINLDVPKIEIYPIQK